MRSRCLLHLSKVSDFAAFCRSQGWSDAEAKGDYEILRMVKDGDEPVIVHAKAGAKEHATTWGRSAQLFNRWRREKRATIRTD